MALLYTNYKQIPEILKGILVMFLFNTFIMSLLAALPPTTTPFIYIMTLFISDLLIFLFILIILTIMYYKLRWEQEKKERI